MKESWKEFADKWVKICLSTEPADRPRAEAAIRGIYKELRYEPPARIEWASSPREERIMRAAYAVRVAESDEWKGYEDFVRSSSISRYCLPDRIQRSSVGITLLSMSRLETVLTALKQFAVDFGGRLFDRCWIERYVPELGGMPSPSQLVHRPAVFEAGMHFTAYLKAYLETHGAMAIGTLLRTEHSALDDAEQVLAILGGDEWLSRSKFTERDKALEYLRKIVRDMLFWELPFDRTVTYRHVEHAAVYNYCRLNGLCYTYPLNEHLVALFESAAGATVGPMACWLYERPVAIAVDERGRPHRNNGPAITYRDGQSVWAYHRVELWEDAIMRPETITFDTILECRNIERRRALIELFGLERFVREMQAHSYCRCREDKNGTLWKLDEDIALVEVVNGTPEPDGSYKHYFLPCDPRAKTATEAVAGTYGLRPEQYRVAKRT
jgi:hypothetical protein